MHLTVSRTLVLLCVLVGFTRALAIPRRVALMPRGGGPPPPPTTARVLITTWEQFHQRGKVLYGDAPPTEADRPIKFHVLQETTKETGTSKLKAWPLILLHLGLPVNEALAEPSIYSITGHSPDSPHKMDAEIVIAKSGGWILVKNSEYRDVSHDVPKVEFPWANLLASNHKEVATTTQQKDITVVIQGITSQRLVSIFKQAYNQSGRKDTAGPETFGPGNRDSFYALLAAFAEVVDFGRQIPGYEVQAVTLQPISKTLFVAVVKLGPGPPPPNFSAQSLGLGFAYPPNS